MNTGTCTPSAFARTP